MKKTHLRITLSGAVVLASVISAGAAAASTGARTSPPTCSPTWVSTSHSPITLNFWEGMPKGIAGTSTSGNYGAIHALVQAFNTAEAGKIVVTDNNESGGYGQTWQDYKNSIATHTSPNVVMLDQYNAQSVADLRTNSNQSTILPITTCLSATHYATTAFLPKVIGAYTTGGKLVGMPFSASVPVMYYNQQAFTQAHITSAPKTMTQLLADQKLLQKTFWMKGTVKTYYKYGISIKYDPWEITTWLGLADQLIVNNNNGHTSRTTKSVFNTATAKSYLTSLQTIAKVGGGLNVYNPAATTITSAYGNLFDVGNGFSGITFDTTAALGTIQDYLGLFHNVTLGVAPLPTLTGTDPGSMPSGGNGLFINSSNSSPAQQAAAWVFIQYLVSASKLASWDKSTGYLPIRTDEVSIWHASLTAQQYKWYFVGYNSLTKGKVDAATEGPMIGPYDAFNNHLASSLQALLTSPFHTTPTAALNQATTNTNCDITTYNGGTC